MQACLHTCLSKGGILEHAGPWWTLHCQLLHVLLGYM